MLPKEFIQKTYADHNLYGEIVDILEGFTWENLVDLSEDEFVDMGKGRERGILRLFYRDELAHMRNDDFVDNKTLEKNFVYDDEYDYMSEDLILQFKVQGMYAPKDRGRQPLLNFIPKNAKQKGEPEKNGINTLDLRNNFMGDDDLPYIEKMIDAFEKVNVLILARNPISCYENDTAQQCFLRIMEKVKEYVVIVHTPIVKKYNRDWLFCSNASIYQKLIFLPYKLYHYCKTVTNWRKLVPEDKIKEIEKSHAMFYSNYCYGYLGSARCI